MSILKKILDRLTPQFVPSVASHHKYSAPMDIAVYPIEVSFIHRELLAELDAYYGTNQSANK